LAIAAFVLVETRDSSAVPIETYDTGTAFTAPTASASTSVGEDSESGLSDAEKAEIRREQFERQQEFFREQREQRQRDMDNYNSQVPQGYVPSNSFGY